MSLFQLFGRKADAPPQASGKPEPSEELEVYSGMRVEVTDPKGQMLFAAKLTGLHGNQAELHSYLEVSGVQTEEPFPVRIRGYSGWEKKAVCMEGVIAPLPQSKWSVTELRVCRTGNDRAFYRLETDLAASATMFSGLAMGEKPCRVLNISVGGACIRSDCRYHSGDKFLLKVRLLEDRPESVMFAQVVRILEKDGGAFEYGCQFLELTEDDQERITQNIFAAQRQKRGRS